MAYGLNAVATVFIPSEIIRVGESSELLFEIRWRAELGETYWVEMADAIKGPWSRVTEVPGSEGKARVTAGSNQGFFRILQVDDDSPALPNSILIEDLDLKLLLIRPGTFMMGTPEPTNYNNETPITEVTISRACPKSAHRIQGVRANLDS